MSKKTLKNMLLVTISNLATIISGVIAGFIIPKIMEVSDYGYYKTFTLYSSYIGLLSLGIADGIVLKYGNKNLDELPTKKIRAISQIYILINIIFSIIGILISLFLLKGNSKYILLFLSLNIPATNFIGYFQQISQITQRFKEYSARNIIKSSLSIFIVIVLVILSIYKLYDVNYQIYIILLLIVSYILVVWYGVTYSNLIFNKKETHKNIRSDLIELIKLGFPLLFANLCSTLLLTLDRQFINVLFDSETYALYAFAYNLLSLITIATSAISTVMFPMLKRIDPKNAINKYTNYLSIILCFIFIAISIYFPLNLFIKWFLPKYVNAIEVFRIIFPGLAISSSITIIMHNYYKILNKSFIFFIKSIIALLISFTFNIIAYVVFKNALSISIASIFSLIIWYVITDDYFRKNHNINNKKNFIYMLLSILIFYLSTALSNLLIGFLSYIIIIILITYLFHKQELKMFLLKYKNK